MRRKRYEILLPLVYNDGRLIEAEKFQETEQDLVAKFGALTTDTIIATGTWVSKGVLYKDKLVRMKIDAPATTVVKDFFKDPLTGAPLQVESCFHLQLSEWRGRTRN